MRGEGGRERGMTFHERCLSLGDMLRKAKTYTRLGDSLTNQSSNFREKKRKKKFSEILNAMKRLTTALYENKIKQVICMY